MPATIAQTIFQFSVQQLTLVDPGKAGQTRYREDVSLNYLVNWTLIEYPRLNEYKHRITQMIYKILTVTRSNFIKNMKRDFFLDVYTILNRI